ncbi:MAG: formate dehydrogenase [Hyphomicrobiales bacterium]|uniref:formate dehydrogenase n=1 Tax=Rhabdaerophilum calidifontis TaxID=2604328 RepID=UPI001239D760|nr:formate dehydrogenase [Rhabdaerophilum calidifontis]MCA1952764.1 formate dehydrogenase [Hyphomicrobiales bacterium]
MSRTKDEGREIVDRSRRGFLGAGLLGATAAAGGVAVGEAARASENDGEKKKARYKETDHVKKYYATNRY